MPEGTTVLLTTQYLDEADRLSDQIAVIDHGKVIAEGTSDELKARVGGERLAVTVGDEVDAPRAAQVLHDVCTEPPSVEGREVQLPMPPDRGAITEVVRRLDAAGIVVDDVAVRRPTLDDVFLTLTGRAGRGGRAGGRAEEVAA